MIDVIYRNYLNEVPLGMGIHSYYDKRGPSLASAIGIRHLFWNIFNVDLYLRDNFYFWFFFNVIKVTRR